MIYRLYSHNCADIILLPALAHELLRLWGKDIDAPQGIVRVEELDSAIAKLEQAVKAADQEEDAEETDDTAPAAVSLRQRAAPVLQMLRRCLQAQEPVLWRT